MPKYVCPYCFTEHDFDDVEFKCVNKLCPKKEQDEKNALYLGLRKEDMPLDNIAFRPQKKLPWHLKMMRIMYEYEECPECKTRTSFRICPSCHNELPKGIESNEDMIIAVVGSRDTGKSHFISVLIHELQSRIIPTVLDGTFSPMNDEVYQHYMNDFYNRVYVRNELLDLTYTVFQKGETSAKKPLIYEMVIPVGNGGKKLRKFTFVFYDTAGEDLKNSAIMRTVNRYICKAAGIIFLLDPLQMRELRANMTDEEVQSSSSLSENEIEPQEHVLKRVAKLIREDKRLNDTQKIDIPVSIAFSKFDVIQRMFPKGSTVLKPSSYLREGVLDKGEWFTVHNEIDAMLKEWGEVNFAKTVEQNFGKYSYCTLSALGQHPMISGAGSKKISRPQPHRVEDPFLWMLKENGILSQR